MVTRHKRNFLERMTSAIFSGPPGRSKPRRVRLGFEPLENRSCLSADFDLAGSYGVGSNPLYQEIGDFNADGKADLAVANYSSNSVSILMGNGDGTFEPAGNYAVTRPNKIAIGDFNGDGKSDLAVPNAYDFSTTVSILLGNGDGTFYAGTNYVGTALTPVAATAGDFNADGMTDLAVANLADQNGTNNVSVLLGNGNGTFQTAVHYASGGSTASLVTEDFNGDGKQDLAVANGSANFSGPVNTVGILLGNGDGTFQSPVLYASATPSSVIKGDFNGDGNTDLAVSRGYAGDVGVLLGNGNGTFQNELSFATGLGDSHAIAGGDFDGNGRDDLALAGWFDDDKVSVLLSNGDGTLQAPVYFSFTGSTPYSVGAGDFNGDGRSDLSIVGYTSNNVSILLNNSAPPALTAQQRIALLADQVDALATSQALSQGNANALTTKLQAALGSLDRGNNTAAANQLQALVNQLSAFMKSGKLNSALAQSLIDGANDAIALAST